MAQVNLKDGYLALVDIPEGKHTIGVCNMVDKAGASIELNQDDIAAVRAMLWDAIQKDERGGQYYVTLKGTNQRWMIDRDSDNIPQIYDTVAIAQEAIDENRAMGVRTGLSSGREFVPISIVEYNEKYGEKPTEEI